VPDTQRTHAAAPEAPPLRVVAAPPEGWVRLKLVVAYDGAPFHEFAANPAVTTVQTRLEEALGRVLRVPVSVVGAGRTDAGVHARAQVVSLDAPATGLDLGRLQRSVNELCGPAIAVRSAEVVPDSFHARFSASWRRYRYTIWNDAAPDPFWAARAWHVPTPLDLGVLRLACDPLVGEHDFSAFCKRPKGAEEVSLVRRVIESGWAVPGDGRLVFDIRATAFCHSMVRSIVGTLVDVGRGRLRAGEVRGILRSRLRANAGSVAPAHGLCLWEVGYP
jgi:tRNA pseudouridine38-40 synthase